jgi:hypothetical protein
VPVTFQPLRSKALTTWRPRKPVAPVTRAAILLMLEGTREPREVLDMTSCQRDAFCTGYHGMIMQVTAVADRDIQCSSRYRLF